MFQAIHIIFIASVPIVVIMLRIWEKRCERDWIKVDGIITGAEKTAVADIYTLLVSIDYEYGGSTYSKAVNVRNLRVKDYPVGKILSTYVNPKHPDKILVSRRDSNFVEEFATFLFNKLFNK